MIEFFVPDNMALLVDVWRRPWCIPSAFSTARRRRGVRDVVAGGSVRHMGGVPGTRVGGGE